MKIGCFFLNVANDESKNFLGDNFFTNNAINSFKKFHSDVEIIYVNDDNIKEYLSELKIKEYYDNLGILRIHIIKELFRVRQYDKIIMLGVDTFTCSRLDEFLKNNSDDMICSLGPPYPFLKTEHWKPNIYRVETEDEIMLDVDFINADVVCFNNLKVTELLYEKSIKYWSEHAEQGGMNYLYQNQKNLNINVSIVDFPYLVSNVVYNVRSKGVASGGRQLHKGIVYSGSYKDPKSKILSDCYPTSTYYVKENKLFTKDNKQIKVFHYGEALGVLSKNEFDELIKEIKTMWFNKETIKFLTEKCDCKFKL